MRVTSDNITKLSNNEIFVFGSNESGMHGAGAASLAYREFGARLHQGFGPAGRTFAIPTKDWKLHQLDLLIIRLYVSRFITYTKMYEDYHFLVTQIGCGLAGYKPEDIAPMFKECLRLKNVYLPELFIKTIKN